MVKTKNQRFQGNLSQDQCVKSEVFGGERLVVPIPYSCSFLCVQIRRTGFGTSQLIDVNQKCEWTAGTMIVRESELTTDYCECPSFTLILCHNKSAGGVYLQRATLVANFLMVERDGY